MYKVPSAAGRCPNLLLRLVGCCGVGSIKKKRVEKTYRATLRVRSCSSKIALPVGRTLSGHVGQGIPTCPRPCPCPSLLLLAVPVVGVVLSSVSRNDRSASTTPSSYIIVLTSVRPWSATDYGGQGTPQAMENGGGGGGHTLPGHAIDVRASADQTRVYGAKYRVKYHPFLGALPENSQQDFQKQQHHSSL